MDICNSYNDFTIFRKEQKRIYHKLLVIKKLKEYTSHMERKIKYK